MSVLLDVRGLTSSYGKISALRDIRLTLEEAGAATVIGPNGAGKTTMLNSLVGLQPSSGEIWFAGERINALSTEERLERGLCLISEKRELFTTMSVEDNLMLGSYPRRREGAAAARSRMDDIFARFPRLLERRQQLAGTLSGGERQMLAIGRALMMRPVLLMLDEPSLGLAPLIVEEVFQIIRDLRESGVTILLVEQNARGALQVADYGYVLETGEIALEGESADLLRNPQIIDAYLGATAA